MTRNQSGIIRHKATPTGGTGGSLLRGVVLATFVVDDPNHPKLGPSNEEPRAIYCDVLVYTSMPQMRYTILRTCFVNQGSGLHDGDVWRPKATTKDVTGIALNVDGGTNPANFDGDHVLIGFLDDSITQPIIIDRLSHPNADLGKKDDDSTGFRTKLKLVDGSPRYAKHRGVRWGVDTNGNYEVDSRWGNDGALTADGKEPIVPASSAVSSNQTYRLKKEGTHTIILEDMANPSAPVEKAKCTVTETEMKLYFNGGDTFKFELAGSASKLTLGDGAVAVALYEALETHWNTTFKNWVIAHTHPTGVGPSGAPVESLTFPNMATTVKSTHLLLPNG